MRSKLLLSLLDCIAATTAVGVSLYFCVGFGRLHFLPPPLLSQSDFVVSGNYPFKFLVLGSVGVIVGTPWAICAWRQFARTLRFATTPRNEPRPSGSGEAV